MIDRRDPEAPRQREMAKLLYDQSWRDGLIGDATYLRSLALLGYTEREARVEHSLLSADRALERHDVDLERSREWLRSRRERRA